MDSFHSRVPANGSLSEGSTASAPGTVYLYSDVGYYVSIKKATSTQPYHPSTRPQRLPTLTLPHSGLFYTNVVSKKFRYLGEAIAELVLVT
jgi:hypothetical protein